MPRKPAHAERHPRTRPRRPYAGKSRTFKMRITIEELDALQSLAVVIDVSAAEYVRRLIRVAAGLPTPGVAL